MKQGEKMREIRMVFQPCLVGSLGSTSNPLVSFHRENFWEHLSNVTRSSFVSHRRKRCTSMGVAGFF